MSATLICPDCGCANASDARACARCNFPLVADADGGPGVLQAPAGASSTAQPAAASEGATSGAGASAAGPSAAGPEPDPPIVIRKPRPRPQRADPTSLQLWLVFGTVCAMVVIYVAVKANYDRAVAPVEGANQGQQVHADSLQRLIDKDSTNVDARVRLGDVLYDTGNWSDAIVQYRAAIRMDSSRTTTIVDLGVCYYNLSAADQADRLFQLALRRDPHQAVALFNLGILNERRKDWRAALGFFHRALQSDPPEAMRDPLVQHMSAVQKQLGVVPPPLPDGMK